MNQPIVPNRSGHGDQIFEFAGFDEITIRSLDIGAEHEHHADQGSTGRPNGRAAVVNGNFPTMPEKGICFASPPANEAGDNSPMATPWRALTGARLVFVLPGTMSFLPRRLKKCRVRPHHFSQFVP